MIPVVMRNGRVGKLQAFAISPSKIDSYPMILPCFLPCFLPFFPFFPFSGEVPAFPKDAQLEGAGCAALGTNFGKVKLLDLQRMQLVT